MLRRLLLVGALITPFTITAHGKTTSVPSTTKKLPHITAYDCHHKCITAQQQCIPQRNSAISGGHCDWPLSKACINHCDPTGEQLHQESDRPNHRRKAAAAKLRRE